MKKPFQSSNNRAKEGGNRAGEGEAYGNLGIAYGSLSEYQKAIEYFEIYLKITKETSETYIFLWNISKTLQINLVALWKPLMP